MKRSLLSVNLLFLSIALLACEGVTNTGGGGSGGRDSGRGDTGQAATGDVSVAAPDVPCEPSCEGKQCGDNGCGGVCGDCDEQTETCTNDQCVPAGGCAAEVVAVNCQDRACGPDGCGEQCGHCGEGEMCDLASFTCVCAPVCGAQECGVDTVCGASCGSCANGSTCEDGACVADYPAGPYGNQVGDTIANLEFKTATDRPISLKSFYRQGKVIILTSAAGWCEACKTEAQGFNSFLSLWEERGLALVYTLYEDDVGNPIYPAYINHWIEMLGLDYPVYQDPDFVLQPYYTDNATPLNMVITTADMQIRYLAVGYSELQVEYYAKKYLNE